MTIAPQEYFCPGETHPVSRSVHLARLAAFYPKCRECPFRNETGALRVRFAEAKEARSFEVRHSVFTRDGVRGRHRNELDRSAAARIAAAFASLVWEAGFHWDAAQTGSRNIPRPVVVVGYDQRPSSPDITAGVTDALRRMGCSVIDIGPVTTPKFWWQAAELHTTGGVLITGSGYGPSWTGLDFLGPSAQPVSQCMTAAEGDEDNPAERGLCLDDVERLLHRPINRPTRKAGQFRLLRENAGYERAVRHMYHALRPLNVVVGTSVPMLHEIVYRLFAGLPCRLEMLDLPLRARDVTAADDIDVNRVGQAVQQRQADVGFLIDDDAQHCGVLDETGRLLSGEECTVWLGRHCLAETSVGSEISAGSETSNRNVLLERGTPAAVKESLIAAGAHVTEVPAVRGVAFDTMCTGAIFGGGCSGRYWFPLEVSPLPVACDALVTLAHVLAALSRRDTPCSEVVSECTACIHGGS